MAGAAAEAAEAAASTLRDGGAGRSLAPLEGELVEIHSLPSALSPNSETRDRAPGSRAEDFNGRRGRALYWDEDEAKYAVHTFDGVVAGVPEACLRPLGPEPPPEHGGFDVAWPQSPEDAYAFSGVVAECLEARGFCVVQMFTPAAARGSAAVEEARRRPPFGGLRAEFEAAFLGTARSTECRSLEDEAETSGQAVGALAFCDRELTLAARLAAPALEAVFGQEVIERSGAVLRIGARSSAEASPARELSDADLGDQTVETFASWLLRRRLCLLYLVDNEGGVLELCPRATSSSSSSSPPAAPGARGKFSETKLPLEGGRLVLFRHDTFEYAYQPKGESLALQAWLLEEDRAVEFHELAQPPGIVGAEQIHVSAIEERFPANCEGCDKTFALFCSGCDAETPVPCSRFDQDIYFMEDRDAIMHGKAYVMHGSFVSHEYVIGFDNEFFGISKEEAWYMAPSQRWVLEVGCSTLHKAGWNRQTLNGQRIGTFIGDSGSEWNEIPMPIGSWNISKNSNTVTVNRLAYNLGLTGPNLSVDTACSASLVAANAAVHMMRTWTFLPGGKDPIIYNKKPVLDKALCMGVLVMVSPSGWIGECAATMLSYRGRCFTFDTSADGFIRGEGCCCVYMNSEREEQALMKTRPLAVVLGTCANQDGRSASLTAPHGPSQQECIRQCLREAGLRPQDVVIGECHGTGTALGDPIEVGAVRGVMLNHREDGPITHCTAKAHVGHEEANAGVCGLIKIILMLNAGMVTPNPHLKSLNAHLDVKGYPVLFNTELRSTQLTDQVFGVSSFGFGGTNSRAECWADVDKGAGSGGFRTVLSREEALDWIGRMLNDTGTEKELDGFMLNDHKDGH